MSERLFRAGFLFSGLGAGARGFDLARAQLGSDSARFLNAGGIDCDPLACADYERLTNGPALCGNLSGAFDPDWPKAIPVTPEELRAGWGAEAPDAIFLSPPCKGHSGLLSAEKAETPEYQEMNSLVFKGLFLLLESWSRPPGLIVLENVPRVTSRGAAWLAQVRQLLGGYGYVFHEEAHDLRRIGNLGAHRRRYLLVARHPERVPAYVFRPPLQPGRSCGDILAELPLPETESAGPMHRLPRLSLLNWIRLALIPPGGDWRDLPGMQARDPEARRRWEQQGEKTEGETHWFKGKYAAGSFDEPARTVIGGPSNGAGAVADPRLQELPLDHTPRRGALGVMDAGEPANTVRGRADVRTGPAAVADDRLSASIAPGATGENADGYKERPHYLGVGDWNRPARTIVGKGRVGTGSGPSAVADPRLAGQRCQAWINCPRLAERPSPLPGTEHLMVCNECAAWAKRQLADAQGGSDGQRQSENHGHVVWAGDTTRGTAPGDGALRVDARGSGDAPRLREATGAGGEGLGDRGGAGHREATADADDRIAVGRKSNGPAAVADPRLPPLSDNPARHRNKYAVGDWTEAAPMVMGASRPGSGAPSVADPRIPLGNKGPAFNDILKVGDWNEAAPAVTGAPKPHGGAAVADPRVPLACAGENTQHNLYHVDGWEGPARTVTGATRPGGGAASVGDPRLALGCAPRETSGAYGVLDPGSPAYAVTGSACIDNGPFAVADGRPRFGNCDRVTPWAEPTGTVTHAPAPSSGAPATADPRIAGGAQLPRSYRPMTLDEALGMLRRGEELPRGQVPVILSPTDGTWHRPLTDLELAALQGLPAVLDGAPLELAGKSRAKHRERVGNAVPVGAAKAIGESLLQALLAAALGTWVLGSTGIWVRRDDGQPAEMEVGV